MSERDAVRDLTCDEVREMAGAFVLGALDGPDEAAMRVHLASHSASHPEIAELGSVIPALAATVPIVEPGDGLKARVMAAAAADLALRRGGSGAAGEADAGPPEAARTVPMPTPAQPTPFPLADRRASGRPRPSTGAWLLRAAAVLVIAVLGGWNLLLQGQLGTAQQDGRNLAAVLDAAAEAGSRTAILAADGGTGAGLAAVRANGDVVMAMRDLRPTRGDSVYEAWVIGGDGVPEPLGDFTVGDAGLAYFEAGGLPTSGGLVLALTLEPGPGATTPTMPIISKGAAVAPG